MKRQRAVLAIDAGTTGVTCLVVAQDGQVLARAYREITQHFPEPGWVEHDAEEIFARTLDAGRALHRAIVWQDRRTAARCAALASDADAIRGRTGLVTDPYFSATKLEWLLHERGLLANRAPGSIAAGTIDSWLIWRLTDGKVHATDYSNASRTMLYDIDARGKNTYGTGAFLLLNGGTSRPRAGEGLLTTIACGPRGEPVYALEASIFIAGAAVQWLRDGLGIMATAAESEPLARSLSSNDGVYFVPALVGLGAPWWEPQARGTIVGLTRGTTRAHLARAALEAMAYSTADVIDTMVQGTGHSFDRLRVDGGTSANAWLMQFQADVLGVPVERPSNIETTALGAAGLAGVSAGVWRDAESFLAAQRFTAFEPGPGAAAVRARSDWSRAVRAALHWARQGDA